MSNTYLSIVIPTLDEAHNIRKLIPLVKKEIKDYNYELIVVDGHSKDDTVSVARNMGANVIFDRDGKGSALIKGFKEARGKIIISMDADLSHEPKELRLLISGIETGYDICVGSRFLSGGGSADMPIFRIFGNKVFVALVNIIYGSSYSDMCYGYRSFTKKVLGRLNLKEKGFGIETEINIKAQKAHLKILEVPSFEKKRAAGEGKLRSFNDGFVILRTILSNI